MQLRAHPCMTHRGVSNWPPVWTCISGQGNPPDDETSSLEEVHRSTVVKNECFLIIECDETRYMGALQFDDEQCCERTRVIMIKDPAGNSLAFAQTLDRSMAR